MKTQETRMMTVAVGALALMVLAPGTFVQALGIYWDGTSASWNTAANWSADAGAATLNPAEVPGAGDDVIFNIITANGAETITLDAAQAALSLTFSNTGTTVLTGGGTARTLTPGTGGITMAATAGAVTLGNGTVGNNVLISLATGKQAWTNNSAAAFTITNTAATFTRPTRGTLAFNKAGTGNFLMSATVLPNVNNIIGPWASFGMGSTTTYAKNASGTIAGLGYTGGTDGTAVATVDSGVTAPTTNYSVTAAGGLGSSMNFNTLRYTGAAGTIPGTWTGNGLMNAGSGLLTLSGIGTIGTTNELVVNAANNDIAFGAAISNNGSNPSILTKTGKGTLTFSDVSYTGGTYINEGCLDITKYSFLPVAGAINVAAGASLALGLKDGNSTFFSSAELDGLFTAATSPSGRLAAVVIDPLANVGIDMSPRGSQTYSPTITTTSTRGLIIVGPAGNTLTLGGTGNFSGDSKVIAGVLKLGSTTALQKSAFDTTGAGTLDVTGYAAPLKLGGLQGNVNLSATIITGYTTITGLTLYPQADKTAAYSGNIGDGAGNLSLTKTGAGTQILTGTNTYTGNTTVSQGTLSISQPCLADGADVKLSLDAQLNLTHSVTDTIRSLYINGLLQPAGVWGAIGSGASNESVLITGTGKLNATTGGTTNYHVVAFNSNGGTAATPQFMISGGTATAPANPTKSGNTFGGWYSDINLTANFNFATPITADIMLYAKWNVITYAVTFNSNGGSAVAPQTVPAGGTATQPADPTKPGNTFGGWYSNSGLTSAFNFATPITADITLHAKWTPFFTVTFNSNGGSAVAPLSVPSGGTATQPADPTKSGNTFGAWYSDSGLTTNFNFATSITADITLYAKWTVFLTPFEAWDAATGDTVISDGGGTWKVGTGNWYNGASYDQPWTDGNDAIIGGGTLDAAGTITISGPITAATITLNPANGGGAYVLNTSTSALTLTNGITANDTATLQSGTGGNYTFGASNTITVATSKTLTISSKITGGFGFTKTGPGTLTLSGSTANDYTGVTTVSAGTLTISTASTKLGTTAGNTVVANGAALRLTTVSQTNAENFTLTGLGTGGASAASTFGALVMNVNSGVFALNGAITLNGGAGINTYASGLSTITIAQGIGGTGDLYLQASSSNNGGAIFKLSNASTYSGNTFFQTRSVNTNGFTAENAIDNALPVATVLTLENKTNTTTTTTYRLNGHNQTLAGIATATTTGTNAIVGGSNTLSTLTVNNAASKTYSGRLGNTGTNENNLALVKTGTGNLTLSGTNSHTGNTTVNAGTLTLGGTGSLAFIISDATTNRITGTGTVSLNGTFIIDTTAVTVPNGSWILVDASHLTASFGSTFSVTGFSDPENDGSWIKLDGDYVWTFIEATGVLTRRPRTGYSVSSAGSDSNPGTAGSPFKTIQKAANVMSPGDVCTIAAGTYRETITPPANLVTFQAAPDAVVNVSGYELVTNWTLYSGSIYQAQLTWNLGDENQLLYNGQMMNLARWPNKTNYNPFDLEAYSASGTNTSISHASIPNWNWSNGGVVYFLGNARWTSWRRPITGAAAGVVSFATLPNTWDYAGSHSPTAGGEFFLENILEALDSEGEWYFDRTAKKIYFWAPGGGNPAAGTALVRKRTTAFNLTGRTGVTLDGFAIQGAQINLTSATNCVVQNCRIYYANHTIASNSGYDVPQASITMDTNALNNVIYRNDIQWGAGYGIMLVGTGNQVVNNYIGNFNYLGNYACPVYMAGSGVQITGNEIFNGGRDLIRGGWTGADVGYNDMHHSNLIDDDCGAYYCVSGNFGYTRIHHNWIHDCYSRSGYYKAAGVYLDNTTQQVIVDHNVMWNLGWACIMINWAGTDLLLYNNTLWCNSGGNSVAMGNWANGYQLSNVQLYNTLTNQGTLVGTSIANSSVLPKTSNPFADFANRNFTPLVGTAPVDAGMLIPGYTDGFSGSAPDTGAYENGVPPWVAGIDWKWQLNPQPFISRSGSNIVLDWAQTGYKLQTSPDLIHWTDYPLPAGVTPPVTIPLAGTGASFFRLKIR